MENIKKSPIEHDKPSIRIVYISSHLPRKCGIATFTNDLITAIDKLETAEPAQIIAVADPGQRYEYPDKVKLQIRQYEKRDYLRAADYINESSIDVVNLQHEFGLYTGPETSYVTDSSAKSNKNLEIENGYYLLPMLDRIKKPIVTTLHTILLCPDNRQLYIAKRIIAKSAKVIAMTKSSRQVLIDIYDCPKDKIVVIGHGVPDFHFDHAEQSKEKLGIQNTSPMILSSGLLGPGKELEYVIDAMPRIVSEIPNARLYIVGQTHPVLVRNEGEVYRNKLVKMVTDNKMSDNVIFINHYLSDEELRNYYQAADFFVTAYTNMQQSASGTLAWAVGSGKICISTPYQYAREMLSDGAGVLIQPRDPEAIATSIINLYNYPQKALRIRRKAYLAGHRNIWANVGSNYVEIFKKVRTKENIGQDARK